MGDVEVLIEGTVAPGFEPVRRLFEQNMHTLAEEHTQLCIYHQGEKVVDLWASAEPETSFSPDSLVNIFSSGKSIEAIAMAMLMDRGLLDFDAPIVDYWPEYGANGKSSTTVADLMRHEAGLAAFSQSLTPEDLRTANIKKNHIGRIIENDHQRFRRNGSEREYHALTRGWIVNEVFRRVDPDGRTVGEFLRDELSGPLQLDTYIGLEEHELSRAVAVSPLRARFLVREGLKPRFAGRRIEHNLFQTGIRIARLVPSMRRSTSRGMPKPITGMESVRDFSSPEIAMGEIPSANTNSNARSLAKLAAVMAGRGSWQGQQIIGQRGWDALHANPIDRDMGFVRTAFSQGGVAMFKDPGPEPGASGRGLNTGREGFYGWMGLGGSIFQWHPEARLGFGYVPTSLNILDLFNERGKAYQAEAMRCVANLS